MTSTELNRTMFALDQVIQMVKGKELDKDQTVLLTAEIQKLQAMVTRGEL